jgi:hypothetical protein
MANFLSPPATSVNLFIRTSETSLTVQVLQMQDLNSYTISFPSGFFEAGEYVLALEGLMSGDRPTPVANYSFRIIKSNER